MSDGLNCRNVRLAYGPMAKIRSSIATGLLVAGAIASAYVEPACAAGYTLIFEKTFHPGKPGVPPKATSLAKTGDGGYVLAGMVLPSYPFAVKVGADGRKEWESTLTDIGETLYDYSVVGSEDGGALLLGSSNSLAYAIRLNSKGEVQWQKAYPMFGKLRAGGSFACGMQVRGGFILVGRNSAGVGTDGLKRYEQLWVLKLDEGGNKIWEMGTFQDGDELFNPLHLNPRGCSAPILDGQGNIAFAVSVQSSAPFVLILKLDADGNELARLHLDDNGRAPRLLQVPNGYLLIETNVRLPEEKEELLEYVLDSNLRVLSRREIGRSKSNIFHSVEAAWKDLKDGIHLAGASFAPKSEVFGMAIGYLNPKGVVVASRQSGFGTLWEPVGLVQGDGPNEVVLYVRSTNDVKLMKFRFSD